MKKYGALLLLVCLTTPALHAMERGTPIKPVATYATSGRTARILMGAASLARLVFVTAPHAAGSTLYSYANGCVNGTASALKVAGGFAWQHKGISNPVTWNGVTLCQNPALETNTNVYPVGPMDPSRRLGDKYVFAISAISTFATGAILIKHFGYKLRNAAIIAAPTGMASALLASLLYKGF